MTDRTNGAGKGQRPAASHLFLVRLWEEPGEATSDAGQAADSSGTQPGAADTPNREWKGKVQHVVSGESHTFQDLPSLLDYLRAMMPASSPGTPGNDPATTE